MKEIVKARIEIALLFLLFIFIMPRVYMVHDFEFWTDWALQIHRHGLTNVYDFTTVDYHPLYFYILWIYNQFQGNEASIIANINNLKFFTLFFDFLPIIALCCFRQRMINERIPYMFLLLNIAYLFNTMVWGQVDAIHTNLLFLAVLAAFYKPLLSGVLFALALAMKPHAIIFIPVLGIIWLYSITKARTWIWLTATIVATLFITVLPFVIAGSFDKVWFTVTGAVGRYPFVSVSAFNLWYLITSINPQHTLDSDTYFILSYKQIGLLLFFISSAIILFPFLFRLIRSRGTKEYSQLLEMAMFACGMIVLYFFYFNTQMHERYAHGIIIFFFFYGVLSKNYLPYILASIPYLLSLDKCFPDYLPVVHYKIIWASKVIAIWYTILVAYTTWLYISKYKIRAEYQLLKEAWVVKR